MTGDVAACRLDRQLFDRPVYGMTFCARVDQGADRQVRKAANRDVLGHGHAVEKSQRLAVFRDHGDPSLDRLIGMLKLDLASLDPDRSSRLKRARSEDGFQQFGSAGAEQAGDSQHLASAYAKTRYRAS